MGSAFRRIDIVHIGEQTFVKAVCVLNGGTADDLVPTSFQINHIIVQGRLSGIKVQNIIRNAAIIAEGSGAVFSFNTLICKGDFDSFIQVGKFLQPPGYMLSVEMNILEDAVIGHKPNQCALFPCISDRFKRPHRFSGFNFTGAGVKLAGKTHAIMRPVQKHIHRQPAAQRVHNRGANAMQSAGIGIVLVVKLTAGVQHGEDHFHTGNPHRGMKVNRHAAAIIINTGRAILVQCNTNLTGKAVGGFINCIINNFPKQMMQPPGRSCSNVHAGAHPYGFKPFKHLNVPGSIVLTSHAFTPRRYFSCHIIF